MDDRDTYVWEVTNGADKIIIITHDYSPDFKQVMEQLDPGFLEVNSITINYIGKVHNRDN